MIHPPGTCLMCGRPLDREDICEQCAKKERERIAFGVWAMAGIGLLLVFTGFLGLVAWHWNRWVAVLVAAVGALTILDALRARNRLTRHS